ncbi:MAG: nucleoside recognition protein [Thermodesulfobacteriota bacterium]|nr:nucleoside recognition protein [Thermodesulfobacteriota bacterium]
MRVALPGRSDGFRTALQQSLESSLRSALLIIKLVVPLYILADTLLYFDLLRHLTFLFAPITAYLDLPAEAAMAVAAGILLNLYAAIAFAAPLGLTPYQWTILAVFLGVCHSLIVECAVMKRLGVSSVYSVVLRGVMAFVTVVPVMIMPASFFGSRVEQGTAVLTQYDSFQVMLIASLGNALLLSIKIIVLIAGIIFFMDWLKSTRIMKEYANRVNSSFSIIVGQLLGITYGAGILIREVDAGHLGRRDVFFIATFLMICHSIIEDALIFVIFGANYWVIVGVRVAAAFIISFSFLYLFSTVLPVQRVVKGVKL